MHYFNDRYEGRIGRHAAALIAQADDNGDGVLELPEVRVCAPASVHASVLSWQRMCVCACLHVYVHMYVCSSVYVCMYVCVILRCV